MGTIYEKVNDTTIRVDEDKQVLSSKTYNITFLKSQRVQIMSDASEYAAKRQVELDEVDTLIAECAKLGVEEPII